MCLASWPADLLRNRDSCCQPLVALRNCGNLEQEQTMMTIVLTYMLGFLFVVATVLVVMVKTIAHRNR